MVTGTLAKTAIVRLGAEVEVEKWQVYPFEEARGRSWAEGETS
jgi:hypothetical protein